MPDRKGPGPPQDLCPGVAESMVEHGPNADAEQRELLLTQFSIERASVAMLRLDMAGRIRSVNEQMCRNLGYTREELLAMTVFDVNPGLDPSGWLSHSAAFKGLTAPRWFEGTHRRKDGSTFPVHISVNYFEYLDEAFFVAFVRDRTKEHEDEVQRARLQQQLNQAQKLESVGRLAGGVAHDFNNMLCVILAHADLSLGSLPPTSPIREDLEQIVAAAYSARDVARHLLAFSRQQTITPVAIDLDRHVDFASKSLLRLIGEDVTLEVSTAPGLWPVKMDPSQIDQVLVNLVVNARDACGDHGKIGVALSNVVVDEGSPEESCCPPGSYVLLEVSDDGSGMDPEVVGHIFEPFFTTKEVGRGTGLGLATVYGIATQNGGGVRVWSEPGQGSRFGIYFPRHVGEAVPVVSPSRPPQREAVTGGAILLVEDDPHVRRVTARILTSLGYEVTTSSLPTDALELVRRGRRFDLLLTDVIMPEMNGAELSAAVREVVPDIGVLYMSGYGAMVVGRHGVLEEGVSFIQKPFTTDDLATVVAEALVSRPLSERVADEG
ncbi:MAG: response regulator [Myxococcales bacterium]|nr:response regulator [Myxococcales bacterium]